MKKLFLLCLAILNFGALYSQNIPPINDVAKVKCTYRIIFQPDSTDKFNIKSENTILLIGSKFSIFQSINKIKLDSVAKNLTTQLSNKVTSINTSNFPKSFFWERIYKRLPQYSITTIERISNNEYAYTEKIEDFKWKLSSNKQRIQGYNCQKAVTFYAGRTWEAWYTTEISISDGPYKFTGLPGLIIKISDTKKHYIYELINISMNNSLPIVFNNYNITYTSRELFRKKNNDFRKNYMEIQIAQGKSTFGDPEVARKRIDANNKRRNNPLELR